MKSFIKSLNESTFTKETSSNDLIDTILGYNILSSSTKGIRLFYQQTVEQIELL